MLLLAESGTAGAEGGDDSLESDIEIAPSGETAWNDK
jgi:hypothetical protein